MEPPFLFFKIFWWPLFSGQGMCLGGFVLYRAFLCWSQGLSSVFGGLWETSCLECFESLNDFGGFCVALGCRRFQKYLAQNGPAQRGLSTACHRFFGNSRACPGPSTACHEPCRAILELEPLAYQCGERCRKNRISMLWSIARLDSLQLDRKLARSACENIQQTICSS